MNTPRHGERGGSQKQNLQTNTSNHLIHIISLRVYYGMVMEDPQYYFSVIDDTEDLHIIRFCQSGSHVAIRFQISLFGEIPESVLNIWGFWV